MTEDFLRKIKEVVPHSKYSQMGEESILDFIFKNIPIIGERPYLVDFGAGNGEWLSNSKYLMEKGWDGLLMDGDNGGNDKVKQERITKDNIVKLFIKYKVPMLFDLLSIDIDGNDYWVLDEILWNYSPSVILAEFNGTIPVGVSKTIKYNPDHVWNNDDYYGASFEALKTLGEEHGYTVVLQLCSTNMFFIQDDILKKVYKNIHTDITYTPQQYHPHAPNKEWIDV